MGKRFQMSWKRLKGRFRFGSCRFHRFGFGFDGILGPGKRQDVIGGFHLLNDRANSWDGLPGTAILRRTGFQPVNDGALITG